jgi:hypothetical protein
MSGRLIHGYPTGEDSDNPAAVLALRYGFVAESVQRKSDFTSRPESSRS